MKESKENEAAQPYQDAAEQTHQIQFFTSFGFQRIINTDPLLTMEDKEIHDSDVDPRLLLDVYSFEIKPYNHTGSVKALYNPASESKPYDLEFQLRLPSSMADAESFPSVILESQGVRYESPFTYSFSVEEEKEIQVVTEEWHPLTGEFVEEGYSAEEIQFMQFTIIGIDEG